MVTKNQTLTTADGSEYLVTAVRDGSVYGVPVSAVDEGGTAAGSERYLGSADDIESGELGRDVLNRKARGE
jgi:hypothetical protein